MNRYVINLTEEQRLRLIEALSGNYIYCDIKDLLFDAVQIQPNSDREILEKRIEWLEEKVGGSYLNSYE